MAGYLPGFFGTESIPYMREPFARSLRKLTWYTSTASVHFSGTSVMRGSSDTLRASAMASAQKASKSFGSAVAGCMRSTSTPTVAMPS